MAKRCRVVRVHVAFCQITLVLVLLVCCFVNVVINVFDTVLSVLVYLAP